MTNKEIASLLTLVSANFPHLQEKNLTPTMILWKTMLADIDYETAQLAIQKILITSSYFPTLAKIREEVAKINIFKIPSFEQAFKMIKKTILRYGFYQEKKALMELKKTHPIILKIIENFGWKELCMANDSQFTKREIEKAYQKIYQKEWEDLILPSFVRKKIENKNLILEKQKIDF